MTAAGMVGFPLARALIRYPPSSVFAAIDGAARGERGAGGRIPQETRALFQEMRKIGREFRKFRKFGAETKGPVAEAPEIARVRAPNVDRALRPQPAPQRKSD